MLANTTINMSIFAMFQNSTSICPYFCFESEFFKYNICTRLLIVILAFLYIEQIATPGTNNTTESYHSPADPETNNTTDNEHNPAPPETNHIIHNEQTILETNHTTTVDDTSNEDEQDTTPVHKSVETPKP